ncbi:MAG: DUF4254 domain-containing protein [Planctomycetes bacterium]|nr:DUF4254 domain-containing protein [Planctomycetota bacterium]
MTAACAGAFAAADEWFAAGRTLFDLEPAATTGLDELVRRLLFHNLQVWHYEDHGRTDEDALILIGWRGAMRHNKHRNESINAIDALFLANHAPTAPLHSESLGALLDRITILDLKRRNFRLRDTATADAVRQQRDELVDYAADLADRLASGRVRVQKVPRLKLYLPVAPVGG